MYQEKIKMLEEEWHYLTKIINSTPMLKCELDIKRKQVYEQLTKLRQAQADYLEDEDNQDDYR